MLDYEENITKLARYILRSGNNIKYIFDIVLFSKSSLNKTLSNIYLILVDERSNY